MNLLIEHVSKRYTKDVWGLRDFSLSLGPGVLGLLGPNGAGKTTLMRILATISKPTEGNVTWDGTDIVRSPDGLRGVLGYLPQDFGVYPNLTPVEFLDYIAAAKGLDAPAARRRIDELLLLVNLDGDRSGAPERPATADRGRADGRTGSRGARPVQEPSLGSLGRKSRHTLHAHRLRRRGRRHGHRHHRRRSIRGT